MKREEMEQELRSEDTVRLGHALKECCCRETRTEQHECWAWTRLQACKREAAPSSSLFFWRSAAVGSAAVLLAMVIVSSWQKRLDMPAVPVAVSQNPHVWASGFHFPEAKADVIWATGYDYIPASYPVK
jgi:anti-sigma-K factor RskA